VKSDDDQDAQWVKRNFIRKLLNQAIMSKQLENRDLEKFETEELHDMSVVGGAASTSTTRKKTLETQSDKDSSAECSDSLSAF
jgi:hypothetical protein